MRDINKRCTKQRLQIDTAKRVFLSFGRIKIKQEHLQRDEMWMATWRMKLKCQLNETAPSQSLSAFNSIKKEKGIRLKYLKYLIECSPFRSSLLIISTRDHSNLELERMSDKFKAELLSLLFV